MPSYTCKELKGRRHTSSLCNPENIRFFCHIQPRVNYDRLSSLKLFPPNVACMVNEIKIPRQI